MKLPSTFTQLDQGSCAITVPSGIAQNLDLAHGTTLYNSMIRDPEGKYLHIGDYEKVPPPDFNCPGSNPVRPCQLSTNQQPFACLIASPLPRASWGRLFRASFTVDVGLGKISDLLEKLQSMRLYVRAMESVEGITLSTDDQGSELRILPTVIVFFEIPRKGEVEATDPGPDLSKVHQSLHAVLEAEDDDYGQCIIDANHAIAGLLRRLMSSAQLEWISALKTLNSLGEYETDGSAKINPSAPGQPASRPGNGNHTSYGSLEVTHSNDPVQKLSFSCEPYRSVLWPSTLQSSAEHRDPVERGVAVVCAGDSDEKVLAIYFYHLEDFAIAKMTLELPAVTQESVWLTWVTKIIADAGGNIIASRTGARIEKRWLRYEVTAAFPLHRITKLAKDEEEARIENNCCSTDERPCLADYSRIIGGFRQFNGIKEPSVDKAAIDRALSSCLTAELAARARAKELPGTPKLIDLSIVYAPPQSYMSERIRRRFLENPYRFTKPMSVKRYEQIYGDKDTATDSRRSLCRQIQKRLTDTNRENIVIVGAYRTGKSTIRRMVLEMINEQQTKALDSSDSPLTLTVELDAATTPPSLLFDAIARNLYEEARLADAMKDKETALATLKPGELARMRTFALMETPLRKIIGAVARKAKKLKNLPDAVTSVGIDVGIGKLQIGIDTKRLDREEGRDTGEQSGGGDKDNAMHSINALRKHTLRHMRAQGPESDEQRSEFLVASMDLLRLLITQLEKVLKRTIILVVAIEEVNNDRAWTSDWAYPAWRHIIENPEFRNIRWLFTATRPMHEEFRYSPLSNSLREYNLEPLCESDATALVNAMEVAGKRMPDGAYPSGQTGWDIHPTITPMAREQIKSYSGHHPYIMQLICSVVYDRSLAWHLPVVTEEMVRQLIETKIAEELEDQFEALWNYMRIDCRRQILEVYGRHSKENESVREIARLVYGELGVSTRKQLKRLGLVGTVSGDEGVIPLFLMWLRDQGIQDLERGLEREMA